MSWYTENISRRNVEMRKEPIVAIVGNNEMFEMMASALRIYLNTSHVIQLVNQSVALEFIHSNERADMIFVDWDIAGPHFIDAVRKDDENHNTPIIIMSDARDLEWIKKSVRQHTFFTLAKPFLEKGLIHCTDEVLESMEHRRRKRVHPDQQFMTTVIFEGIEPVSIQLVDISIDGVLLRASTEFSQQLFVYNQAEIDLVINVYQLSLNGRIYRIGHDRPVPKALDTVLIMIKFLENAEESMLVLQDILDDIQVRWE